AVMKTYLYGKITIMSTNNKYSFIFRIIMFFDPQVQSTNAQN
ncbi:MAG: hypothetical protein ACI9L9_002210, partial [Marivirga sp.]